MKEFFPKLKLKEWLLLLGFGVVFLILATWNLTRLPIFVDEALYLRWAQIAWKDASWRFISLTDGKQPLYIWFVIPFMKLFTDPLYAGRLASVVSGLFAIYGMGYLGWLLGNKKTGLFAMVLTALSPYLFFYYRFGIMEATLIASIVWVTNLSILLARTRRLDVALILGMVTGAALLVKSSALFFCLMIPASYLLVIDFKKPFTKENIKYLMLVGIAWLLAFVIYNVQRLSPWMHMIGEKNSFFTVKYSEVFSEPMRLWNNTLDVWRWQIAYTTIPVLLLFLYGLKEIFIHDKRKFWLQTIWLFGPMLGTVAIARLFAPRYILYVTPFVLLYAAYGLGQIKKTSISKFVLLLALLQPITLIYRQIFDPINYPYVSVDEGYVNGWSAGNGCKQIAQWARERAATLPPGQILHIYTEGTFGTLPHGIELYAQGINNLVIEGIYPINEIPPVRLLESATQNPETYLVLNNTETAVTPDNLELVASYPKLRDNPMRLYKVIPR